MQRYDLSATIRRAQIVHKPVINGIAWRFTRVLAFTAAIHLRSKG